MSECNHISYKVNGECVECGFEELGWLRESNNKLDKLNLKLIKKITARRELCERMVKWMKQATIRHKQFMHEHDTVCEMCINIERLIHCHYQLKKKGE